MVRITFLLLLFAYSFYKAEACSCTGSAEYSNHEMCLEWHNMFPLAFTAMVDSIHTVPSGIPGIDYQEIFLHTITVYRGTIPSRVMIIPPHAGSSCAFTFETHDIGRFYIFYGFYNDDGSINTHFCYGSGGFYRQSELDTTKMTGTWLASYQQQLDFLHDVGRQQNGPVVTRYTNGQQTASGNFRNGLPVGDWIYYNYYGKISAKGHYKEGVKDGKWTEYMYAFDIVEANGKRKTRLYWIYTMSGNYIKGKKQGVWVFKSKYGESWKSYVDGEEQPDKT